jgi:hypothetical protein
MTEIDPPGPDGGTASGRPQHDEGTNLLAWLRENKVLAGIVLVVALALGLFLLMRPGAPAKEPASVGTTGAAGQMERGAEMASASPSVSSSESPSATPSATPPESASQSSVKSEPVTIPSSSATATSGAPWLAEGVDPALAMDPDASYEMSPPVQDPEPVAEAFAGEWMSLEGGKKGWLSRLKPLVTDHAYEGISYTDEMFILDEPVTLINIDDYEEGMYEIPFRVFGEHEEATMDGTLLLQPDGSWKVDAILPPNELVWD